MVTQSRPDSNLKQRRGLGTRLRYHRKLVAVSSLKQRRGLWTRLGYYRKLVAVCNLKQRRGSGTRLLTIGTLWL